MIYTNRLCFVSIQENKKAFDFIDSLNGLIEMNREMICVVIYLTIEKQWQWIFFNEMFCFVEDRNEIDKSETQL